ncbi:MAG: peptide chain release factor N(5)-glutamine methyltransferase [Clostridia bacterium]|nr:peptide chain release factor N(5)-glutamine methyltransferase [Clostridia bacterium]
MNIKDLLIWGRNELKKSNITDYEIIPNILLEHTCNISRNKLAMSYEMHVSDEDFQKFSKCINKVISGIPVQYITNKQEFMGIEFYVDENVLIPQPDTEILVEKVVELFKDRACKILDLCTGSGAIAISLAKIIDNASVSASDISSKALQIAKLNAEKNLVHRKINFIESDMFENINDKFDIIVSNPPYIETDVIDTLDEQVQSEPHIALDGGHDGLKFYRIIIENAVKYMNEGGMLFLEIGYNQKESVMQLIEQNGGFCDTLCIKDYGENDRVIVSKVRG